ncbi:hypothetical protein SEA_SHAWTY_42 [Streptomyces phage Shawty]|uniref:Lipoprotein n=1 Tax=Streptomyces phage Shawty TaxID=2510521 RepID=A0A411CYN4_9CAUD|nr:hypothetical protein SEA_SHAWTY_42 [Streptomyces phage Shawty]
MKKRVAVAAVVAVAALGLTGCDDGPECVDSHTTVTLIPVFNGKTTTLVPTTQVVCDRYADEKGNA